MAVLESCPKHNMVAYLEKTDGNAEFHEIIDFLARSSIHNALTVSPVVSTTFVEQFWMSAKSKIINNVRYITAKVAGKPVSISEASIRSDLLFDDADGIDSLPNQAIFDAIQLMGYEGDLTVLTFNKALFSPQWRFLFHTMNHCISSKSTSWDQIPTNIATAVICLTSNQKYNFSKLIFDGMLRHLDAKKKFVMYPRFISVFLDTQLKSVPVPLDHFLVNALTSKVFSFMVKKGKHFSGKVTPLFSNMLVQPTEDEGEQLERPSEPHLTPSPSHPSEVHVEPQSDPSHRPSPTTHIPDSIPEDSGGNHGAKIGGKEVLEETVDAKGVYMGRSRFVVHSEKEREEKEVSTDDALGTDKEKDSTDKKKIVPIDQVKNKETLKEKEKGVELKDVEETERPRPTSTRSLLTLKPLPKIDPKDKAKKKITSRDLTLDLESAKSNTLSVVAEALGADAIGCLCVCCESRTAQSNLDPSILSILAVPFARNWVEEGRHKTSQKRFLAEQRAIAIRNKPPTRTQLRNQMMTYLKHVGNKKHSDLKNKTFEEIQALYEKVKRFDESFTAVGSTEDERRIKEMNERVKDPDQKSIKKRVIEETPKKDDITEKSDVDSEDEHRKCLKIVPLDSKFDIEVMETKSVIARLNKVSSPDGDYLVIYRANGNFRAFNCLLEVLHIFDRQDLFHLYDLVMEQYSEITLEGIELILWRDLKIMMESSQEENDQSDFWDDQQDWEIVTWILYEACRVYILELKNGTVIHMLVKRRYPLSKDLLQRMHDLGLEVERESTAALDLIRFIKQQIDDN
ncbi:hypothetical protein Tco_1019737 [Tanacetum coccineum]|uniref:Uncharacterized protein n=1 Tax=Tanacetum coccineum TaxID=301880 RepID=A0ABQ5G0B2_9ASTR